MSKKLILSALLTFGAAHAQDNHIVIMGGGSEPQNLETTIFDSEMRTMGRFLNRNRQWSPKISFNGGHDVTEDIIENGIGKLGVSNTQFTQEAFERMITEYENKINNGTVKTGDQLLVYISTHGAMKQGNERTHQISATGASAADLNSLRDAKLVSMDRLQRLINLAEQKGVKLGIMDFSCHSGNSLALQNPNTCIITASGPNHFGYANWGDRFTSNMARGKNLEEVFLETFQRRNETAFPMISTPVGNELQDELYSLLTPYLYSWKSNPNHDKLTKFLEGQVVENQCEMAEIQFQDLMALTSEMENALKNSKGKGPSFQRLQNAITAYHNFQKQMTTDLKNLGLEQMASTKEKFCSDRQLSWPGQAPEVRPECVEYSIKEILGTDHDAAIAQWNVWKAGKTGNDLSFYNAGIANLQKAKLKKAELLANNPNYVQYSNYYKNLPRLQDRTWDMAMAVSTELQKVYTEAYRHRSIGDTRPNACRNFVL